MKSEAKKRKPPEGFDVNYSLIGVQVHLCDLQRCGETDCDKCVFASDIEEFKKWLRGTLK